jgi:hypothetical protein
MTLPHSAYFFGRGQSDCSSSHEDDEDSARSPETTGVPNTTVKEKAALKLERQRQGNETEITCSPTSKSLHKFFQSGKGDDFANQLYTRVAISNLLN